MTPVTEDLDRTATKAAFRVISVLVGCYLAMSLAAVLLITVIPGDFPLWTKLEGGLCGLLLLGVVIVVNGKHPRSVFSPA
jgi:hypothetical protein